MTVRTLVPPVLVVLLVAGLAAIAARSPLQDEPQALRTAIPDDLTPVVAQVDAQLQSLWTDSQVEPAARADDLTVLRRLSLALHGTIPSLEEIRRFEADQRPDRLQHWTTALLEDNRFADYFAERLARAYVGVEGGQFVIYRRDRFTGWLGQQIQQHRPYDAIVRDMVSGTGVWTGDGEVNFLTGVFANDEFDHEKLTGRTVRAFLGQRIDCAQCHDHPFDHWKQSEFEGLTAHYGQVRVSLVGVEDDSRLLFRLPDEVAADMVACRVSPRLRGAFGKKDQGLRESATIEVVEPDRVWVVRQSVGDEDEPKVRFICRRGEEGIEVYDALGEYVVDDQGLNEVRIVKPSVPFGAEWVPASGSRREQLAAWVTHPENRRFERAIANRVWGLLFGRPYSHRVREYDESLQETVWKPRPVDDLPDPDRPDTKNELALLDILGADFRAHGCDLRRLVQVIAASRAFRLESVHPVEASLDELEYVSEQQISDVQQQLELIENRWAVFPLVRLRPEQVIGAMLQANHVTTIDQNSHLFVRVQRFFGEQSFVNEFGDPGEAELQDRVGTISQALLRMNGQLAGDLTKTGPLSAPGRIAGMASTPEQCLDACYLVCLTRRPTDLEKECFLPQLADKEKRASEGLMQDLYWTLFNSPEFSWNH